MLYLTVCTGQHSLGTLGLRHTEYGFISIDQVFLFTIRNTVLWSLVNKILKPPILYFLIEINVFQIFLKHTMYNCRNYSRARAQCALNILSNTGLYRIHNKHGVDESHSNAFCSIRWINSTWVLESPFFIDSLEYHLHICSQSQVGCFHACRLRIIECLGLDLVEHHLTGKLQ